MSIEYKDNNNKVSSSLSAFQCQASNDLCLGQGPGRVNSGEWDASCITLPHRGIVSIEYKANNNEVITMGAQLTGPHSTSPETQEPQDRSLMRCDVSLHCQVPNGLSLGQGPSSIAIWDPSCITLIQGRTQ